MSKELSLTKILKQHLFYIPDYQRGYSWTTTQVEELCKDIDSVSNSGEEKHYLSSIYCIEDSKVEIGGEDFTKFEVVDGQQRLTTLLLLFRVLYNMIDRLDGASEDKKNQLRNILYKESLDNNSKFATLESNHQGKSKYFTKFILTGEKLPKEEVDIGLISDKNLDRAITSIESYLQGKIDSGNSPFLEKALKSLQIELIQLTKDQNVYKIFQSLNSRGLPMDSLDKMKSIVFLQVIKLSIDQNEKEKSIKTLNEKWKLIYEGISKYFFNSDELVRFTTNFHFGLSESKIPSIKICLQKVEQIDTIDSIFELLDLTIKITDVLSEIKNNWRLRPVTKILQSRFLAVSILLGHKYGNSNLHLNEEEKNILLQQWEVTSFRVYGLGRNDARYLISKFVYPGYQLYKKLKGTNPNYYPRDCYLEIKSISDENSYKVDTLKDRFPSDDCYLGWGSELAYLFNKVNEYHFNNSSQADKQIFDSYILETIDDVDSNEDDLESFNSNLSIEHIMPASAPNNLDWKTQFETDNPDARNPSIILNRIGNLILVPKEVNSGAKDKPYPEKVRDHYSKPENDLIRYTISYKSIISNAEQANGNDVWNCRSIKKRSENLAEFIPKIWKDVEWNLS